MDEKPLPPLAQARVAGGFARTAFALAREMGADLAGLAARSGLPASALAGDEDVPVEAFMAVLQEAADAVGDPLFGLHVGLELKIADIPVYGLVLATCSTIGEAMEQAERFESLAHDLGRGETLEIGDFLHVRWHSPWKHLKGWRHATEMIAGGARAHADWLARMPVPVFQLRASYPAPEGVKPEDYQKALGGAVQFSTEHDEVISPRIAVDLPIPGGDPALFATLKAFVEKRLAEQAARASASELVAAVRDAIGRLLMHNRAHIAEVARAMKMSERTLQRRLQEEGWSFSDLLEQTRRALAAEYLGDPRISVMEVALMLGFCEHSSFTRAFRSWYGASPREWRQRELRST